jgi:hypothetical protein
MSKWIIIRTILIIAAFVLSAVSGEGSKPTEDVPLLFLPIAFIFGVIALLFVVGVQRINPWSAKLWRYPDWSINPFQMREPIQFFHFGGYFMVASGAGGLIHQAFTGQLFFREGVLLTFGTGILAGVRACTVAYQEKMVSTPQ